MKQLKESVLKGLFGEKILENKFERLKVFLMASGSGSNAENLMSYAQERSDRFEVVGLGTDNEESYVRQRAQKYLVPVITHIKKPGQTKESYDQQWLDKLFYFDYDFVFLCGYMKILSPVFINHHLDSSTGHSKIVNIHPSFLPHHPGLHAYEKSFTDKDHPAGVTLHLVDDGVDTGKILLQEKLERSDQEDFASFQRRGLSLEHTLYRRLVDQMLI